MSNDTLALTTPEQIARFRLIALRAGLSLEIRGLKRKGPSAYSILKRDYGYQGTRRQVLDALNADTLR